jgi:hypothetical protein
MKHVKESPLLLASIAVHRFSSFTDMFKPHDLYPPTRVCQSPECVNYRDGDEVATLTDVNPFRANLFMLRDGSLPVHSVSAYG